MILIVFFFVFTWKTRVLVLGIPQTAIHSRDGEGDRVEIDTMVENDPILLRTKG